MKKLVLIDGNSIMNRAFYGIMGNKMLTTKDGTYTNAVYGFLAIMFKIIDDINPDYMAVAFDLKAPTARHLLYKEYKGTRKGMPDELAVQMPIIKKVLNAMNIKIFEKEGYEADDILGTLAKFGEKENLKVTILSGDRDTFQLASDNITIRIPRTKAGKTEEDDFDKAKVYEVYGLEPKDLIEVKGLMGDSSDNIPGVPGVGEKTALSLVKEYKTIENIYKQLEEGHAESIKGKLREKISENKELAMLSKTLGTINVNVPIDEKLEDIETREWNKEEVYNLFKELNFNRYIERFNLLNESKTASVSLEDLYSVIEITSKDKFKTLVEEIEKNGKMFYYFSRVPANDLSYVINEKISSLSICIEKNVYYISDVNGYIDIIKDLFENKDIEKIGFKEKEDYILLKQMNINFENMKFDVHIAGYILDSNNNSKYSLEYLSMKYLNMDFNDFLSNKENNEDSQLTMFDNNEISNDDKEINMLYAYSISKLYIKELELLKETNQLELFEKIEMPTSEVLADMQWNGMYVDKDELIDFGKELQEKINCLTKEIYELCEEEFNINSTKQLGIILFEKLNLPVIKKTKSGYSTDVDVLEKLKRVHPVIEKLLEYRQLTKLNSTYVEGLLPYINVKTNRIHSYFHQTVTATGRISSSDPNLQNIPTRINLGKQLRKVFKAEKGYFVDADYSQIELRVLAHMSQDENMINAFINDEDIHKQVASKVLNIPMEEVTKEQRSNAKAVNFGIVYGISDFGLSEQLGISRKQAKEYIEQYLEKYSGIKGFMDEIPNKAKEQGYVETLFHRRRYIPELESKNYMIREFGKRAAMNTPIQGTAADIMKMAMCEVYKKLKENNLKSKLVLQIHDELIIEAVENEKDEIKKLLKNTMENIYKFSIPLKVEVEEGKDWYSAK